MPIIAHEFGHHLHAWAIGETFPAGDANFVEGFGQLYMVFKEAANGLIGSRLLKGISPQWLEAGNRKIDMAVPDDEWPVAMYWNDVADAHEHVEDYQHGAPPTTCASDDSELGLVGILDSLDSTDTTITQWAADWLAAHPPGDERDHMEAVSDFFEAISSPDACPR